MDNKNVVCNIRESSNFSKSINSNDDTKKCPKCGSIVNSSNKFCPNCGKPLTINNHNKNFVFKMVRLDDGKYKLISLNKKDLFSIRIPSCVSIIGENAFKDSSVINVQLNEGLIKIEKGAFSNCKYLNEINFPSTLKIIEDEAFKNCVSLEVKLPSTLIYKGNDILLNTLPDAKDREFIESYSQLYKLEKINNGYELKEVIDKKIRKLILPDFITSISSNAFMHCSYLNEIRLPNNIKTFYLSSLKDLEQLKDLYISSSVESITKCYTSNIYLKNIIVDKDNKFYDSRDNCNCIIDSETNELIIAAENFNIPQGVTSIDFDDFCNISKDITLFVPKSLKKVTFNEYLDYFNHHIKEIVVEEGHSVYLSQKGINALVELDTKTLTLGCKNTKIPEGVEAIGKNAFKNSYSPLSLYIPSSVKYISNKAFLFSKNLLESIDVSKDNQKFYSVSGSNTIVCKDTDVLILGCNTSIIPSNVKVIANYSFMNCKFIRRRINIPKNVSCDYDAFKGSE